MRSLAPLFIGAVACGGASSSPTSAPTPAPLPDVPFAQLEGEQRMTFMEQVVMPEARAWFAAFDPTLPEATCETCHGEGVADGSYELPSAQVEPLPNTPEGFMAWVAEDADAARWAEFMVGVVVPKMAGLLRREAFDPATETGDFSCDACHALVATP
ncbi:MAG: hypothetical protein R2939_11525 [Kofleriaceae bacterium]